MLQLTPKSKAGKVFPLLNTFNSRDNIFRASVKLSQTEEGLMVSQLYLQNVSLADNGTYHCHAKNTGGSTNSKFDLHVTNVKESFRLISNYALILEF